MPVWIPLPFIRPFRQLHAPPLAGSDRRTGVTYCVEDLGQEVAYGAGGGGRLDGGFVQSGHVVSQK